MRTARIAIAWMLGIALLQPLNAQIPAQEDLEAKSKRETFLEGLETREARESSAKDVGEALQKIEGVWKLRKGGIANDIVLRGFQGNNLNTLIDGVRIYGACPGHMDPAAFHVDFAEVDHVEVTKGVFDVANQGSLAGSVNIVRKRPGMGLRLSPSLQLGSFGYINPSLNGSYGNDKIEVSGGFSYRRSHPFEDARGAPMTTPGAYRPEFLRDDAFRVSTGWGAFRFSPARHQSGEISYARQDGANTLYPYLQMDSPYDISDRISARYALHQLPGSVSAVEIQSYYTRVIHWMTDEKRLSAMTARDRFGMGTFARTRAAGGRSNITLRQGAVVGFEFFQRNWDAVNSFRTAMMVADQNIVPNVNTTVAGAFADWNKSLTDRIRIGAGARLDTANMYVRGPAVNVNLFEAYKGVSNLDRRDTNPSANLRIHAGLTNYLEYFAGAGTMVRLPDAQERYFNHRRMGSDWVGNPGLRPSRNSEFNTGINVRHKGFFLKPLFFYSGLRDFILIHNQARIAMRPTVMNTMARSYANGDARMYGGELSFGLNLGPRWMIHGGSSYVRGTKDPHAQLGILDTDLPEIPALRARSAVRYGTRLWFAELEGVAARRQIHVDGDLKEMPTPGYGLLHAKAGLHWRQITLTAGIDNLLDHYYIEHLSFQRDPFRNGMRIPEPGRSLFLNIGYRF